MPNVERNTELLIEAARQGNLDEVRRLIPLSDPKADDSQALRVTAENGYTQCVALLIPVSNPKAEDSAALFWAARKGHTDIVDLLFDSSDPNNVLKELIKDHPEEENNWQYLKNRVESQNQKGVLLDVVETAVGTQLQRKM